MSSAVSRSAGPANGSERLAIDDHPKHEGRRLELVEIPQRRLVQLEALQVGVARLEDLLEDRAAAVRRAHQEQRLRDEAFVVHRERGRSPAGVVCHRPGDAAAAGPVEVAESVRRVETVAAQELHDLAATVDRTGADAWRGRDRHRCPSDDQ